MSTLNATMLNAFLVLLSFMVTVLLHLINLRFQKEADSVFQALPKTTKLTFAILIAFGWTCGIAMWADDELYPAWAARIIIAMVFFACLFVASLASLAFPDALPSLGRSCQRLGKRIIDKLRSLFTRIRQFCLKRNPPVLPLTKLDTGYPGPIGATPQY
ncbi:hypothetical protein VitviT2T_022864 [Vitis vinifera]|uniref:Uncharacterized protein n=2 Tax=Vitis vinifera TaxID=29760 RepID=A0A438BLU8_VITVI|nr:hypothetical protein CK203_112059 [Vitis vinifera]WKA04865.1 hypothetical protein VitviT2T_022864 [Vitis vinifera]